MAELAKFFELTNQPHTQLAALARDALESLANMLRKQKPELAVKTHAEALTELEKRGLYSLNSPTHQRGKAQLLEELSFEQLQTFATEPTVPAAPAAPTVPGVNPELAKRAAEQLEKKLSSELDDSGEFSIEELVKFRPKIVENESEDDYEQNV
jgi:hypothetical protein